MVSEEEEEAVGIEEVFNKIAEAFNQSHRKSITIFARQLSSPSTSIRPFRFTRISTSPAMLLVIVLKSKSMH